jgi:hypothetical protein
MLLAVAPLLWAGAEREILTVSSEDMVERNAPTTVTYVSLPGLAMSIRLPAPGGDNRPPYGLLVRDTVGSEALTVVMTSTDPLQLRTRSVTGRLQSRPYAGSAAAVFDRRGESTAGLVTSLVLIEVTPGDDEPVQEVAAAADLAGLAEGTLLRVPLAFDGEATAICVLADEGCPSRSLAEGSAVFVHLARGDSGLPAAVLVQISTPTSVVAGQWQGGQVRNEDDLVDFASSIPVQALAGWGRILVVASIADDPRLIRDRSWLGPILLASLAILLWIGGRLGYPSFRPMVEGGRRWVSGAATAGTPGDAAASSAAAGAPFEIPLRVSGHALTTGGHRRHLDEAKAVIRPAGIGEDGRMTAALDLADGARIALAAFDTGVLGRVERGEVISLAGVRPALWAHWYGTDLRMTFSTAADRDRAAELVGAGGPSVRSPS